MYRLALIVKTVDTIYEKDNYEPVTSVPKKY